MALPGAVPFHEVLEELLALLGCLGRAFRAGDAARIEVTAELGAEIGCRRLGTRVAAEVEPDLRRLEPGPARERAGEIDLAPFWMARRLLELADLRKQRLDEIRHSPVAVVGLG